MISTNYDYLLIKNRFPHIAKNIEMFWGHSELLSYINNLFLDTRDGKRQGFPEYIIKALWQLLDLHHKQFPNVDVKLSVHDPFHKT